MVIRRACVAYCILLRRWIDRECVSGNWRFYTIMIGIGGRKTAAGALGLELVYISMIGRMV